MKLEFGNEIIVDIIDTSHDGRGVAKYNDEVIFVDSSVQGDKVIVVIKKAKRKFAEASVKEIISPSKFRIDSPCEHFGTCNGCKFQHTAYTHQLQIKRKIVEDAFRKIGGFENFSVQEVISSSNEYHYRNKIEFSFSQNKWMTNLDENKPKENFSLGFHKPGFIDKVIDINICHLQPVIGNNILNFTREFFKQRGISIYNTRTNEGFLRFLVIRFSFSTNEVMINLVTHNHDEKLMNEFTDELKRKIPAVTSFINSISARRAQVAVGEESRLIFGKDFITEQIGDYKFKVNVNSFFQTNSLQCKILYDKIIELAEFTTDEDVLDLYCGCGSISIYISKYVNSVHGVEVIEDSIKGAYENAELNKISNCTFEASDVKQYLQSLLLTHDSRLSTVILDPPRSGIHPKIPEYLLQLSPKKIIYVSCNPSTQARDIALLKEKYEIAAVQPVEMFPQTHHIENIVRLDVKS